MGDITVKDNNDDVVASGDSSYSPPVATQQKIVTKVFHSKKVLMAVIVVVIVLLALGGGLLYMVHTNNNLKKQNASLSNPQAAAQATNQTLITQVGKLIVLPTGETPTIATVVDASKLQSQAFFAKAQNGDKVLLYSVAKEAILYRPSSNKIVEVAPINIGSSTSSTTPSK